MPAVRERRQWRRWRCTSWDAGLPRRLPSPACPRESPPRRGDRPGRCCRGLPPDLHDDPAQQRRDPAARLRALAQGDGIEPPSARRIARTRPRRPALRDPAASRRDLPGAPRGHGPIRRGVRPAGIPAVQRVDRGQRSRPAAALVRRRGRHPRRAHRQRIRRRRPHPDDGRAPDRVEEAPGRAPRRGDRARRGLDTRRARDCLRRPRRRLAAAVRDLGPRRSVPGSRRSPSTAWRFGCGCSAAPRSATRE